MASRTLSKIDDIAEVVAGIEFCQESNISLLKHLVGFLTMEDTELEDEIDDNVHAIGMTLNRRKKSNIQGSHMHVGSGLDDKHYYSP